MAKGRTISNLYRASWCTEAFDELDRLLVHSWSIGRSGSKHHEGRLTQQLDELSRRLDRCQIERARTAWDQDEIGYLDRSTRRTVSVRRSIYYNKISPLPSRLFYLGRESWWWAVDHLGGRVLTPCSPLARSGLGISIDDERYAPNFMGGSSEVKRQRRLAGTSLLANDCYGRHNIIIHVDTATMQHPLLEPIKFLFHRRKRYLHISITY
ncbi:hypothetical protein ASE69_19220 [Sphingomonas sp. Leaf208]|nr:hypothetical protein ASE69_19220 [Sphingomonas sp. Leaf208]